VDRANIHVLPAETTDRLMEKDFHRLGPVPFARDEFRAPLQQRWRNFQRSELTLCLGDTYPPGQRLNIGGHPLLWIEEQRVLDTTRIEFRLDPGHALPRAATMEITGIDERPMLLQHVRPTAGALPVAQHVGGHDRDLRRLLARAWQE